MIGSRVQRSCLGSVYEAIQVVQSCVLALLVSTVHLEHFLLIVLQCVSAQMRIHYGWGTRLVYVAQHVCSLEQCHAATIFSFTSTWTLINTTRHTSIYTNAQEKLSKTMVSHVCHYVMFTHLLPQNRRFSAPTVPTKYYF
jgi:hypothetical protein